MYKFVLVIISLFYGIHTINAQEFSKIYSSDNNTLFRKTIYSENLNCYFTLGEYGISNQRVGLVIKFDLNGNIIWSKKFNIPSLVERIGEVIDPITKKSHIIISGSTFTGGNNLQVIKVDADDGSVVWSNRYSSLTYPHSIIMNNDIYLIGSNGNGVVIAKLNTNGTISWNNYYSSQNHEIFFAGYPDLHPNGNMAFTFRANQQFGVMSINPKGEIVFSKISNVYRRFRNLSATKDGFIFSYVYSWENRNNNHGFIKIDTLGKLILNKRIYSLNPNMSSNFGEYSVTQTESNKIIYNALSGISGRYANNYFIFNINGILEKAYDSKIDSIYIEQLQNVSRGLVTLSGSSIQRSGCISANTNGVLSLFKEDGSLCGLNQINNISAENDPMILVNTNVNYTNRNLSITQLNYSTSDLFFTPSLMCEDGTSNFTLGADITSCGTQAVTLNAGVGYNKYIWSTGASSSSIQVSTTNNYWVEVTDACNRVFRDTIRVTFGTNKTTNNPVSLCPGQTYTINNKTYSVAGTYRDTLKTSIGCDSVVVTNLSFTNCGTPISGVVNKYSAVTKISCNTITVENGANFSVGNRVLLIQMQGAKVDTSNTVRFGTIVDYRSAGLYEFNTVLSKSGNNIVLEKGLNNSYNIDGRVQLVYVPVFTDVYIQNEVTGTPWNGKIGGIIAIEASGTIRLGSKINADGIGFRGGFSVNGDRNPPYCLPDNYYSKLVDKAGGHKGEGIAVWDSSKIISKGAWANGGGGGNIHNAGGAGGSLYSIGGKGGKVYEDPQISPVCQGGNGINGYALNRQAQRVYQGGGGGAGHDNDRTSHPGGNGGGIVFIKANKLDLNNQIISSNGETPLSAGNDGGSGGGAGGTILIEASTFSSPGNVHSKGGNGADNIWISYRQCVAPGGGGSGGFIQTSTNSALLNINIDAGLSGRISPNHNVCPNSQLGATDGTIGQKDVNTKLIFSNNILNSDTIIIDTTVCFGKSIIVGNTTYSTSGTFYHTVTTNGCPVVTKITLLVLSQNIKTQNLTICQGQSVRVGNNFYSETGIYKDTLTSIAGCDSIVTTRLQVFDTHQIEVNYNICLGDSVKIGNSVYKSSGLYTDVLKNINGCDSIVKSNIQVNIPTQNNISYKLCPGDSIEWSGNYYFTEGLYRDTLTSSLGCDSVYTTIQIEFVKSLTLDLGKDTMACHDEILQIGTDQKDLDYLWSTGSTESYIDAVAPRVYSLTISNQCYSISDTIQIDAIDCDCTVFIPNAFSPNGDGKNDILLVKEKNISHSKLIIYNKWGEEIFEVFDNEISWNGMKKDKHLAPDVYGYYYVGECLKGNKIELKGNITIVR